ncbi:hypothetical protein GCM10017784_36120 [Deinococcus indicus]|uniref:hypothetical protein n=1 Tax=Deinococcus indicus TaxID=223556 RepID=UPI00174ACF02|nr:hypothetical protein [Deinococcus indicus]GHG38328.1 hypothetical protein GCM10017784_36120 [Deinococcus indicus]
MRATLILAVCAALVGCSTGTPSIPPATPPDTSQLPSRLDLLGYVQVTTDADPLETQVQWVNPVTLKPQSLDPAAGVQFRAVTAPAPLVNDTVRGERYLHSTLQVHAPGRRNLYLLAVDTPQTISDTAFTSVRNDAGAALGEAAARAVKPAHRMSAPGAAHPAGSDLVVFTEAEIAARTGGGAAPFPWGFAARVCLNSACSSYTRTFDPDGGGMLTYPGRVTLAFKVPLSGASTPRSVSGTFAVYQESGDDIRVTQTTDEQASGTVAGLNAPNAQALPSAFRVTHFPGSSVPFGTRLNAVRTSGPASAPTGTLFAVADPCAAPSGSQDPCFTPVVRQEIELYNPSLQTNGQATLLFGERSGFGFTWDSLVGPQMTSAPSLPSSGASAFLLPDRVLTAHIVPNSPSQSFQIDRWFLSGAPDPAFSPITIPYQLVLESGAWSDLPPIVLPLGAEIVVVAPFQHEEISCAPDLGCTQILVNAGLRTLVFTSSGQQVTGHPLNDLRASAPTFTQPRSPSCSGNGQVSVTLMDSGSASTLVTFSTQGATTRTLPRTNILACQIQPNGNTLIVTGGTAPRLLTVTGSGVTDVALVPGGFQNRRVETAAFYADGRFVLGVQTSSEPPATAECGPDGACGPLRPVGPLDSSLAAVNVDASGRPLTLVVTNPSPEDGGPPILTLTRWMR